MNGREPEAVRLSVVPEGKTVKVRELLTTGSMRRRLLDIGLIPGTRVTCTAVSPAGDPAAYLIRGAVIALRGRDAGGVYLGDALWD